MSATIASTFMEIISIAQQELGRIGNASGSTKKNSKSLKKESTRKGRPTAHGDFTKKILEEHQAEKDAFIAARTAKAAAGELLYTADDSAVKKGKHSVGDAYSEDEAKKGAHLNFIAEYKSQHMDEYKAFEVKWKETHPKDSASSESDTELLADNASATGSVADATSTTEPVKKKRVISEEQKAKMKAGREATAARKKAEKLAGDQVMKDEIPLAEPEVPIVTAPVIATTEPVVVASNKKTPKKAAKKADTVAPVVTAPIVTALAPAAVSTITEDEETSNDLLPFKYAGANYLRVGMRRANGNYLWATGDLWASNKGSRGAYIGCLAEDGKSIDRTAEEPELD